VFGRRETEDLAAFVRDRNLALISDEAYEDLIYDGTPHLSPASLPGMWERTISVFTLSKTYAMTGWRLGYVVAPERWRSALQTVVLYTVNGVSTPGQWAAVEALGLPDAFFDEARAGYVRRRDALVAGLSAAGFVLEPPAGALYAFPRLPEHLGTDSKAAASTLLGQAGIATVPGIVFGPEGEGHLRFSFSVPEETIAGGMDALKAFAAQVAAG
jgi:aspartate aminotransferase